MSRNTLPPDVQESERRVSRRDWVAALGAGAGIAALVGCSESDEGSAGPGGVEGLFTQGLSEVGASGLEVVASLAGNGTTLADTSVADRTSEQIVFVLGYYDARDGGQGFFQWDGEASDAADGGTVFSSNLSTQGRWRRIFDGPVNVRWFGARGDASSDDTAALQNALDFVRTHGGVWYLPAGRYVITDTLNAQRAQGVRYFGNSGSLRATRPSGETNLPQFPSTIVWQGAPGGTMFAHGGRDCIFDGIALQGAFGGDATRAGIGFHLAYMAGLGTGKVTFPTLHISNCDVAFQCGDAPGDGACDTLVFNHFFVQNCFTGFLVKNDQGQYYTFLSACFLAVRDHCFHFERGGSLWVGFVSGGALGASSPVTSCSLLTVGYSGLRTGNYFVGYVRFDYNQLAPVTLANREDVPSAGEARIVFNGGDCTALAAADPTFPVLQLRHRTSVTLRHFTGLAAPVAHVHASTAAGVNWRYHLRVVLESCGISRTDTNSILEVEPGAVTALWRIRSCWKPDFGAPIPDAGNIPHPIASGPAANRPASAPVGEPYFDTSLVPPRPIWFDGVGWVDATGTVV